MNLCRYALRITELSIKRAVLTNIIGPFVPKRQRPGFSCSFVPSFWSICPVFDTTTDHECHYERFARARVFCGRDARQDSVKIKELETGSRDHRDSLRE